MALPNSTSTLLLPPANTAGIPRIVAIDCDLKGYKEYRVCDGANQALVKLIVHESVENATELPYLLGKVQDVTNLELQAPQEPAPLAPTGTYGLKLL